MKAHTAIVRMHAKVVKCQGDPVQLTFFSAHDDCYRYCLCYSINVLLLVHPHSTDNRNDRDADKRFN